MAEQGSRIFIPAPREKGI
ncbi:BnaCnng54870D [Brassica napus]|uniref:BnaCnng54870D protein n=1 Tax=Brassica napus TaxID=3708 RepID=A0A078JIN4_BRANA|nr:BnaCnng54870D [Brassica napus]